MINADDMRNILRHRCEEAGSVNKFALQHGLNQSFVNKIVRGECQITKKIAKILGYERKVYFTTCNPENTGA